MALFEGKGSVECELNYGSKHDGSSIGHTVPFSFILSSNLDNIKNLAFYGQGMILDNSLFYE